jgi:hypothetical protein
MLSVCIVTSFAGAGQSETAPASELVFPADAGVVNVKDYGAAGDGKTDDTAAIQKALDAFPGGNRIIYLPHGTYLVSDTLRWSEGKGPGAAWKRTILQGQSTAGSVIRLKDKCPGFDKDPASAPAPSLRPRAGDGGKAVIWTGKAPAQRFRNAIRNLTVHTGVGNLGAIGVQFIGNNQACVRDVLIISGDAGGPVGLDLGYSDEQGPCLIQNVAVDGFKVGISTWGAVDSITFVNISLSRQRTAGLLNGHQVVSIEGLHSRNSCPAITNASGDGVVTLVGADISGGSAALTPAIVNKGLMYARDVKTRGYAKAIANAAGTKTDADGPDVAEFSSHQPVAVGGAKPAALNLPVKAVPQVPWDKLDDWVSPLAYGGKPGDAADDTAAIQAAIDSGKPTVYLPNGKWTISGDVIVRGAVRRIIGCEADITGKGLIRVVDGDAPVVVIERLQTKYAPIGIIHQSKRALVLSSLSLERGGWTSRGQTSEPVTSRDMPPFAVWAKGPGELFMEDICGEPLVVEKEARVWARQFNPEASGHPKMTNNGGQLWILGLKTEGDETALIATGGKTEIVGAFIYANTSREKQPLLVLDETAALSLTMGESSFKGQPFKTILTRKQGDKTQTVTAGDVPRRIQASAVSLLVVGP